eukprot:8006848-Pyramimonas_sp.AAC.3
MASGFWQIRFQDAAHGSTQILNRGWPGKEGPRRRQEQWGKGEQQKTKERGGGEGRSAGGKDGGGG